MLVVFSLLLLVLLLSSSSIGHQRSWIFWYEYSRGVKSDPAGCRRAESRSHLRGLELFQHRSLLCSFLLPLQVSTLKKIFTCEDTLWGWKWKLAHFESPELLNQHEQKSEFTFFTTYSLWLQKKTVSSDCTKLKVTPGCVVVMHSSCKIHHLLIQTSASCTLTCGQQQPDLTMMTSDKYLTQNNVSTCTNRNMKH